MNTVNTAEAAENNVLYEFKGKAPALKELIPLSLQHVLAAVVGVVTPAIIVANTCGYEGSDRTMMIQGR